MPQNSNRLYTFIGLATFAKLLLNITRRLVYPFAPEFARGAGVGLSAITPIIALNQATAVLGPIGASAADKYGNKPVMLTALAALALGTLLAGTCPVYAALALGLFLSGLAKSLFDPSLQSFIGSSVPYNRRGRFIGITETSWAGSTLVGIPLAGLIITRFSWQTPFILVSVLSCICFLGILRIMPKAKRSAPTKARASFAANWRQILKTPAVPGTLGFAFFVSLSSDNLFVVYGAWLEQSYDLSLAAIGMGTVMIGIAEILGESLTALASDRLGLKKSVFLGGICCCLAYLLLPLLDRGVGPVLAGLFLVFLFFEFTFVTSMGLATELVPELRTSALSAFYAMAGMGRVAGAFIGGFAWSHSGILTISIVSGAGILAGLACLMGAGRLSFGAKGN